jgi:crotonobetainyl-CoA:carnitine CoA-transferase CaiB-like acyl-CoA transferase
MTDLTEWAAGGLANSTRRPFPGDPERYVPVVPPGHQPQALAGIAAATGAMAAWRWSQARREPVVVDVSVQEVVASTLHGIVPNFVWNGDVLGHPTTPSTSMGFLLPAADGDVYIRTVEPHQWVKLMAWVGDPDWAAIGVEPRERLANHDVIRGLLGEWSAPQPRAELFAEGQRRKVPIALPRSLSDVVTWQHLRARGAWSPVELDGQMVDAPALPMLEPPAFAPNRSVGIDDLARAWRAA